jgi:hypothetical protein
MKNWYYTRCVNETMLPNINGFERPQMWQFSHSTTGPGSSSGTTTYHRKNMTSLAFECAGYIHWSSNTNATVCFGVDEVNSMACSL